MSKYVESNNYITIQGWMRNDLGLKGAELIIYAIIFGFTQQKGHWFHGSLQYLSEWAGVSRQCCMNCLKRLQEKNLITKEEDNDGVIKTCRYTTKFTGVQLSYTEGVQLSLPNNINNINIISSKNNIPINSNVSLEKEANNNFTKVKEKKLTKKQLLEIEQQKNDLEISNIISQFTDNSDIQKLLRQYVDVRKQKGLSSAQLYIMLEDLKSYCGNDLTHQEMCIRKAIAGGWSQIVFIDNFKGNAKTSYSSVDNTKNHFVGFDKIDDDEFSKLTRSEKIDYLNHMAIADMTEQQKQFFDENCLATDEDGNILTF